MICSLTNRQKFTITTYCNDENNYCLKMEDKFGDDCGDNISVIYKNKMFNKNDDFAINLAQEIISSQNKYSFYVEKKLDKYLIIAGSHGLNGGGRIEAMVIGTAAAVFGVGVAVTAPFWAPTVTVGVCVGVASATLFGAGTSVAKYGYEKTDAQFKDSECAVESLKGGAKAAVGAACVAATTLLPETAGVMAPIKAIGAGAVSAMLTEAAGQICDQKFDGRKLATAGTVGGVSGGAGLVAKTVVNKIPLDKVVKLAAETAGKASIVVNKIPLEKMVNLTKTADSNLSIISEQAVKEMVVSVSNQAATERTHFVTNEAIQKVAVAATKSALISGATSSASTVTRNLLNGKKVTENLPVAIAASMCGGAVNGIVKNMPLAEEDEQYRHVFASVAKATTSTLVRNALNKKDLASQLPQILALDLVNTSVGKCAKIEPQEETESKGDF